MNRIEHFLRAQTEYSIHSPLVYRLYTEVLFSKAGGRGRSAADVAWRLEQYYGRTFEAGRISTPDGTMQLIPYPHRSEQLWRSTVADTFWQVSIDLYTCGLLIHNPHLSKQHFMLR